MIINCRSSSPPMNRSQNTGNEVNLSDSQRFNDLRSRTHDGRQDFPAGDNTGNDNMPFRSLVDVGSGDDTVQINNLGGRVDINTGSGDDTIIIGYPVAGSASICGDAFQSNSMTGETDTGFESLFDLNTLGHDSGNSAGTEPLQELLAGMLGDKDLAENLVNRLNDLKPSNQMRQLIGEFLESNENSESLGRLLGRIFQGGNTDGPLAEFADQVFGAKGLGEKLVDQFGQADGEAG